MYNVWLSAHATIHRETLSDLFAAFSTGRIRMGWFGAEETLRGSRLTVLCVSAQSICQREANVHDLHINNTGFFLFIFFKFGKPQQTGHTTSRCFFCFRWITEWGRGGSLIGVSVWVCTCREKVSCKSVSVSPAEESRISLERKIRLEPWWGDGKRRWVNLKETIYCYTEKVLNCTIKLSGENQRWKTEYIGL